MRRRRYRVIHSWYSYTRYRGARAEDRQQGARLCPLCPIHRKQGFGTPKVYAGCRQSAMLAVPNPLLAKKMPCYISPPSSRNIFLLSYCAALLFCRHSEFLRFSQMIYKTSGACSWVRFFSCGRIGAAHQLCIIASQRLALKTNNNKGGENNNNA